MKRLGLEDLADMVANGKLGNLCKHCYYCDKVSYSSELEAKSVASDLARQNKGHSWVYECRKGNGWHLTSQRPQTSSKTPKQRKKLRTVRTNFPQGPGGRF